MSGYESDTYGRSYTIRIRYVWTQIFLYPHKKICGYKNLRIRVDGALLESFSIAFSANGKRQAELFSLSENNETALVWSTTAIEQTPKRHKSA